MFVFHQKSMLNSHILPLNLYGILLSIAGLISCGDPSPPNSSTSPILFMDLDHMERQKQGYQNADPEIVALIAELRADADQQMQVGPYTVVAKEQLPPSGDKHDYMSQGPYWWPDTTQPDGLPYIRRDGEVNPERHTLTDRSNLQAMMTASDLLAKTYFFTEEEMYAEKAKELLQVWFLDEATKMNPHLEYGQRIPVITEGRGIGIIETRDIGMVLDAVALLRNAPAWTEDLETGLKNWMTSYLYWLVNSKKGNDEAVHPNNHGTWYDVQACAMALFTGKDSLARSMLEQAKVRRWNEHLAPDGSQPRELARTLSFNYSAMNLLGLFRLAQLGEIAGVDLWHYQTPGGATLQTAVDYLLPAALGTREWGHEQIKPYDPAALVPHLILAARIYDPKYATIAEQLIAATGSGSRLRLFNG